MLRAHKIALSPTPEQAQYFIRACGVARFAWNWALDQWRQQYAAGGKPSEGELRKQLNACKRQQFPWMLEVTKFAPAAAIQNLGTAFARFFAGHGRYPRFKKKGVRDSFLAGAAGCFTCKGKRVRLPVVGWVKMRQELRFTGRLIRATVSRTAGRWFVAILVDVPWVIPPRENQALGGVDLGVRRLATCSDGLMFDNPLPLRRHLRRLKRLARRHGRKCRGSRNRRKSRQRLARLHSRIANIRKDALHKATTQVIQHFTTVVIEDLNVRGMLANPTLARAIADVGLHEFRRQLTYKAALYGTTVVVADRWFPSSQRCSVCGHRHRDLALGDASWTCSWCGTLHDRDLNAARNLAELGVPAGSREVTPEGDRSSATSTARSGAAGR
jgi:putative transposase